MIQAERQHVEAKIKKSTLEVRSKELSFFISNFRVLAQQATFLMGVAFGALFSVPTYLDNHKFDGWLPYGSPQQRVSQVLYLSFASVAIGCNLIVMVVSVYCLIFGTDLAYRGSEMSMSRAIEGMYAERKFTLRMYYCGLTSTVLTFSTMAWCKVSERVTVYIWPTITLLGMGIGIVLFVRFGVRPRFRFPKGLTRMPGDFTLQEGYDPEKHHNKSMIVTQKSETHGSSNSVV